MSLLERVTKLECWVRGHNIATAVDIATARKRQATIDNRIDDVEARLDALAKAVSLTADARGAEEESEHRFD
jgi:hypothetical protein